MKRFIALLLPACLILLCVACSKYEDEVAPAVMPVTEMVKTGDWMVNTYVENGVNISNDIGLSFIKFNPAGTLVVTKEGNNYNGIWVETKSTSVHTIKLAIVSTDVKVLKLNGTWQVASVSEYFIDLKDGNPTGNAAVNLMKH